MCRSHFVAQQRPSLFGLQLQPSLGGRAVTVDVPLRERMPVLAILPRLARGEGRKAGCTLARPLPCCHTGFFKTDAAAVQATRQ